LLCRDQGNVMSSTLRPVFRFTVSVRLTEISKYWNSISNRGCGPLKFLLCLKLALGLMLESFLLHETKIFASIFTKKIKMLGQRQTKFWKKLYCLQIFTVQYVWNALRMMLKNFHCHETKKLLFCKDFCDKIGTWQFFIKFFFRFFILPSNHCSNFNKTW
jgi:hypothetical protein